MDKAQARYAYLTYMLNHKCTCTVGLFGMCDWCLRMDNNDRKHKLLIGRPGLINHWTTEKRALDGTSEKPSLKDQIWEITKSMATGS